MLRISENKYGPIEMVICCAAMSKPAMFLHSDFDQYKHHMELNYLGVIKVVLPIVKRMHHRKTQGRVVLIGDPLASHYSLPGMAPYACSKAAVE